MAETKTTYEELLKAGVHFGHLKSKWNPNMSPYIFMERNGIHVIDLHKTIAKLDQASTALKQMAKSGKKILFVATKKQARNILVEKVKETNMPFVTERWPGGMLTNFSTIRKAIRKMDTIDKMSTDGTFENISKKERLMIQRQRKKLEKNLGSIADLNRLPAAIFIIDIKKEHNALMEARKLNIPTFAMVDTNSDPTLVDFPIPSNDDAAKSIEKILDVVVTQINEGLSERKKDKQQPESKSAEKKEAAEEAETQETVATESSETEKKKPSTRATKAKAEETNK